MVVHDYNSLSVTLTPRKLLRRSVLHGLAFAVFVDHYLGRI